MRGLERIAAVALAASMTCAPAGAATVSAAQALARYKAAWESVNTYRCTVIAHEALGTRAQDRVYDLWFAKPHEARMDITAGDGRGSAAVWEGGETVRVHQGGFFSFIKVRLNIHDPRATSIRGATVAETNFGWLYDHLTSLRTKSISAAWNGAAIAIAAVVADPSADGDVTKEVVTLGPSGLPVEYDQFEGAAQVKKVFFTDLQLNPVIPPSKFSL